MKKAKAKIASTLVYPLSLSPTAIESYVLDGRQINLPTIMKRYKKWEGEPIADTWGGKSLIDYGGKPMFAELAIMHDAIISGWSARWVETYGMKANTPYFFKEWKGRPLTQDPEALIKDGSVWETIKSISEANGTSYGAWDVVAWNQDRSLFIESKRHKNDKIRDTQLKWMFTAIDLGFKPDDFIIVQWSFE